MGIKITTSEGKVLKLAVTKELVSSSFIVGACSEKTGFLINHNVCCTDKIVIPPEFSKKDKDLLEKFLMNTDGSVRMYMTPTGCMRLFEEEGETIGSVINNMTDSGEEDDLYLMCYAEIQKLTITGFKAKLYFDEDYEEVKIADVRYSDFEMLESWEEDEDDDDVDEEEETASDTEILVFE